MASMGAVARTSWFPADDPMTGRRHRRSAPATSGRTPDVSRPPALPPSRSWHRDRAPCGRQKPQIQRREHAGQVFLPGTEVVFEVVAPGFQRVESLGFDRPAGPSGGDHRHDIVPPNRHVGDAAVAGCDFLPGIGDLDTEPLDVHRLGIAAQRHTALSRPYC